MGVFVKLGVGLTSKESVNQTNKCTVVKRISLSMMWFVYGNQYV